ncbi:isoflavone reductase family protein [Zalerion maritima]|uniref:Isoflavone reductase family protein n=1 Tax=Zalerion maritima TaxID=339359 RepID=A0AAD5RIS0_9PEZI|nr:isoflavone reductase family protein [Zalerion maritima]
MFRLLTPSRLASTPSRISKLFYSTKMSFTPSSILIFGATGNIGQHITSAIVGAQPKFDKVTIFTSQNTVDNKQDLLKSWSGINVVAGDISQGKDVSAALQGVDTVVSCVGRGALNAQTDLIQIAEAAGVKWFFPSEYGTDIEYGPASATEKPHQMKLAVRNYVRENVKSMKVTYLVTGPYIDFYFTMHPSVPQAGGWNVKAKESVLLGDGNGKVGFCSMRDVGRFLAASLRHPEASFGKALKVQSFVCTPKEIQAEFEKQTGGGWDVRFTPFDELKTLESRAWTEGSPVSTIFTLRRIWTEGGTLYEKNDNETVGMGPGSTDTLEWAVGQAVANAK